MKKIFYIFILVALGFTACDSLEDIHDEIDDNYVPLSNQVSYTLTEDDYKTIADFAEDADPSDTINAEFIKDKQYFTDAIKASKYVPALLADLYPALREGSGVDVTLNYNGSVPEDLAIFASTPVRYTVSTEDYASVDSTVGMAKFFSPSYPADIYIPGFIAENLVGGAQGDLITVEYNTSSADPRFDYADTGFKAIYTEGFVQNLEAFTSISVIGDQVWSWDKHEEGNAKITGYDYDDKANYDNEDWIISPEIDLSEIGDAYLQFHSMVGYGNIEGHAAVKVSTNFDGETVNPDDWEDLAVDKWPVNDYNWTVEESTASLSDYVGSPVYIALVYTCTVAEAPTWEIADVSIYGTGGVGVIAPEAEKITEIYEYDTLSFAWEKREDVYVLTDADYDAMGDGDDMPGEFNSFSANAAPKDYLSALVEKMNPIAGDGATQIVVYKYYTGSTITLADMYTKNGGEWLSSYNYIEEKEVPFKFVSATGQWMFDPTVNYTFVANDYMMLVDYVKSEIDSKYIDSYGTAESYFGGSSYYENFDMVDDGSYDTTVFKTGDEAVIAGIATWLPLKYPDAVTQVDQVDVMYDISFNFYKGGTNKGTLTVRFQCTKAGPDPEFTFIEGPF